MRMSVDFRYGHSNLLNMLMQRRTKIQIPVQLLLDNPTEIGLVVWGMGGMGYGLWVLWNEEGLAWWVLLRASKMFNPVPFAQLLLSRGASLCFSPFEKIIPHSWPNVPKFCCPLFSPHFYLILVLSAFVLAPFSQLKLQTKPCVPCTFISSGVCPLYCEFHYLYPYRWLGYKNVQPSSQRENMNLLFPVCLSKEIGFKFVIKLYFCFPQVQEDAINVLLFI